MNNQQQFLQQQGPQQQPQQHPPSVPPLVQHPPNAQQFIAVNQGGGVQQGALDQPLIGQPLIGQPMVGTSGSFPGAVVSTASFQGGINLTISNGAINIRPSTSGSGVAMSRPDDGTPLVIPQTALVAATMGSQMTPVMTTSGLRLPTSLQPGQLVNLKIPNVRYPPGSQVVLAQQPVHTIRPSAPGAPVGGTKPVQANAVPGMPAQSVSVQPAQSQPIPLAPNIAPQVQRTPSPIVSTTSATSTTTSAVAPQVSVAPVAPITAETSTGLATVAPSAQTDGTDGSKLIGEPQVKVDKKEPPENGEKSENKMTTTNVTTAGASAVNKTDTIPGDFDAMDSLKWENGIGILPGSDLKFRMNEFGGLEVVTDDVDVEGEDLKKDIIQEEGMDAGFEDLEDIKEKLSVSSTDEICRCENCGCYGIASEFCNSGRFCSKSCVGMYASKRGLLAKKGLIPKANSAEGLKLKKRKRAMMASVGKELVTQAKFAKRQEEENVAAKTNGNGPGRKKGFNWQTYMEQEGSVAAPDRLFVNAFPQNKNSFRVGMKLEGIDPKHPSLYSVLTVAEVCGYRLRLHFDGYSECYDFWTNADSPEIFPAGWCEKSDKELQPPKGFTPQTFNWNHYLKLSKASPAPKHLFSVQQAASVTPHGFRIGLKLEAVDKKNTALTCVATVADVVGDRLLIHFDGWEDIYDYWCEPTSPYIHPVGWCQENGKALSPPNDCKDVSSFTWEDYLRQTKSQPVPSRAFKAYPSNPESSKDTIVTLQRPPLRFEAGYKLEAVDKRNPILVRVATVAEAEDYRVKLHFDGWSDVYDYWVDDDSPDLHPVGWCSKTGHPLQPPVGPADLIVNEDGSGCPTPGCKGIGHIKGAKYIGHHSAFGCPYSNLNMNKETALADRLGPTRTELAEMKARKLSISPDEKKCPTSGCDSSGHITGKYTSHHRISGCPLAEQNRIKMEEEGLMNGTGYERDDDYQPVRLTYKKLHNKIPGKRGRKKHKFHGNRRLLKEEYREPKVYSSIPDMHALHQGIHQSVFMPPSAPTPNKDMPLCWEQHSKLLPGVDKILGGQVAKWSIDDVANFIRTLPGCMEQANVFKEEQIDGEAFLLLNQADIVKIMNIKLGPALKIYNSIVMFKKTVEL
ncbi:lethal(3)malignant brain tumor-like protein 4 isoform X2 [Lingula anatina]|uniref:Lethal(3)malignant brain tumor-like protein 1 n=1 Tax=Lingula anatina TaxID=7574 RepID=A0A1S3JUR0_LINAN|nr:lethal(3)malignant brain tumor-like protein 4 isoform X2 [Lingula anatina]|eukprot:XP_013413836.1 lethal(3)malignant brain tumor-like protein 4 isoform X2 [Lingula anatina]